MFQQSISEFDYEEFSTSVPVGAFARNKNTTNLWFVVFLARNKIFL